MGTRLRGGRFGWFFDWLRSRLLSWSAMREKTGLTTRLTSRFRGIGGGLKRRLTRRLLRRFSCWLPKLYHQ